MGELLPAGFYNMDCMEAMKGFPDGYFDLAVVDPPYGINVTGRHKAPFAASPMGTGVQPCWGGGRPFGGRSGRVQIYGRAKSHRTYPNFTTPSTTTARRAEAISASC